MLEVTNLSKSFGRKQILDDINFSLKSGDILGFIGKNGAGKTTTLKIIATLLRQDKGKVELLNFNSVVQPDKIRQHVGIINGDMKLPNRLTALEALQYQGYLQNIPNKTIMDRIKTLSKTLGIDYLNVYCESLSTGMAQRVLIARALIHFPPLILLDEASNGLDVSARSELQSIVKGFAENGRGIIYSTHILSELEQFATKTVVIQNGKIVDTMAGFEVQRIMPLFAENKGKI
jgi:sodium transport system ATP-binding protein